MGWFQCWLAAKKQFFSIIIDNEFSILILSFGKTLIRWINDLLSFYDDKEKIIYAVNQYWNTLNSQLNFVF